MAKKQDESREVARVERSPLMQSKLPYDENEFAQLMEFAKLAVQGGYAGHHRTPAGAFTAMVFAKALGVSPLAGLHQVTAVNGVPGVMGKLKIAIARRAGAKVREWIENEEHLDSKDQGEIDRVTAYCEVTTPDGEKLTRKWSLRDARRARLWPGKEDSNWRKYPLDMLKMRARGRAIDDAMSEQLLGLGTTEDQDAPERYGGEIDLTGLGGRGDSPDAPAVDQGGPAHAQAAGEHGQPGEGEGVAPQAPVRGDGDGGKGAARSGRGGSRRAPHARGGARGVPPRGADEARRGARGGEEVPSDARGSPSSETPEEVAEQSFVAGDEDLWGQFLRLSGLLTRQEMLDLKREFGLAAILPVSAQLADIVERAREITQGRKAK